MYIVQYSCLRKHHVVYLFYNSCCVKVNKTMVSQESAVRNEGAVRIKGQTVSLKMT